MQSNVYTQQLVDYLAKEQHIICMQQKYYLKNAICPSLSENNIYVNTLVGLELSNELTRKNIQMKEICFYKIKMMKNELNNLEKKLEEFKGALKIYSEKFNDTKKEM
ncbi:hypothetical protein Q0590_05105 [Rhodocytophaga aerolata]|uniref:Uncharacterized protein n=1 Tax=Rhodocytophaga aerolata TaxID=455078 RepID=A0ABT8R2M1_9BACT|nr:hypothetical protein [Rhodocytophaga aerolata]MDO1445614.1 hypothetical protein [Rhodocytophaga aerolata]